MLTIVYDRNFREDREKHFDWHVGQPVREIAPHRIIELWADGQEKKYLDNFIGTGDDARQSVFYGDLARTAYLNLLHNK